jgi:hypothetical protein
MANEEGLWTLDRLLRSNLKQHTRARLADLAHATVNASRERARSLLRRLVAKPGPLVALGTTEWGEPVQVPLEYLVSGCFRHQLWVIVPELLLTKNLRSALR